ncbi:MAG: hypothetical protein NVS4B7_19050 [Ktedonobacteraceae bacterium]
MVTLCTHCGVPLRDDARFCNHCGTLVPSHPLSPQFSKSVPSAGQDNRVVLREQVAQQIPPRPVRFPIHPEPPAWLSQLNSEPLYRSKVSFDDLAGDEVQQEIEQHQFSELPTASLPVSSNAHVGELRVKVWMPEHTVPKASGGQWTSETEEQLEDLPTRPLTTNFPDMLSQRNALPASPRKVQQPQYFPQALHTPPPQLSVSVAKPRKSRKPLAIVLFVLVLLVLFGSLSAWIVLMQPFSVASITQPQQSFKDTQLGVSLLYPSSWTSQVDRGKATVYMSDSSHTGQVNIVDGSISGNPNQYIQQEASQLGMTGQKTKSPLSFAGTTWQQLQGTVQQKGASYTATLLVTTHNQHLYTIMLLAPQSAYTQEEQYVFIPMRSSFQFLS